MKRHISRQVAPSTWPSLLEHSYNIEQDRIISETTNDMQQ